MGAATDHPEHGAMLDVARVRDDFPILARRVNGRPLVYLDNAATTQKPTSVLDAMSEYYLESNANAHRGVHALGHEATLALEQARSRVARFVGAGSADEIVFTGGATHALNMMAHSMGSLLLLREGDEILLTEMEHHANIVPWQMAAQRAEALVRAVPVLDDGRLDMDALASMLNERTKIVSVAHISNVLGTVNPVAEIARLAHGVGAEVVVDGCQAVSHTPVDVAALGCDAYCFGAHKVYGPMGIGATWRRGDLLRAMPPYQTGGGMIRRVSFEGTTFAEPPARFEPGTPNIAGAVGLAAAIDYLESLGVDRIAAHERTLHARMVEGLRAIPGVTLMGDHNGRAPLQSFTVGGAHPHDLATVLDMSGVAVRAGHHCAQPLMDRFGVNSTLRASIGVYNTETEIDAFLSALRDAAEALR